MTLEITKNTIISGIYTGKEILFFFIGLFTLIITPMLRADTVGTIQLLIIGSALFLEGLSSMLELAYNFITDHIVPMYENNKAKRKRELIKN
jgi:hypothetical protein